jgi:outer membrane receptor protein involved in Fe transport
MGLLALLPGGALPVHAQPSSGPTGVLRGRVIDDESGDALQGATVALWRETASDSTLVTGVITGPEGRFSFDEVPVRSYTLRVSYVGYTNQRRPGTRPVPDGVDLGTIALSPNTTQAEGVEVTAERPAAQIEPDRTVYNTSRRAVSAGGSARTVLETLPSLQIDTDGSISYRGNESVALHINGEPASLQGETLIGFLQSLPADAVKRVEIIPNPSAKYEPEGMAGIINIVLERDLNAGWGGGFTLGGRADANRRFGGNGSANVGYQSEALRVVTTYSYRRGSEEDTDTRYLERFDDAGGPETTVDQDGFEEELEQSHSLTSRLDYTLSAATSLGLEGTVSLRRDGEDGRNEELWDLAPIGPATDSTNVRLRREDADDETIDGRLSFDHAFTEDEHTLDATLRYERDVETEANTYSDYELASDGALGTRRTQEREVVNEDEQEGSFALDYLRPLGPVDVETGYKGTLRRLDSDRSGSGAAQAFTFDEVIHAAYGIVRDEWGVFKAEAGLRAETVQTTFDLTGDADATESRYTSLYPSAFLTYEPSERQQARLSYSKRVDRPSLWAINPIDDNENPTFRSRGNPGLEPEYIHSFEVTATQRWGLGSVTVTPYVRHTVNEIERVETEETVDGRTVTVRQAQNLTASTSYGTELVGTFSWTDRLEGTLSVNGYRAVTDGSNLSTDLSNDALRLSTQATVRSTLHDGLRLEVNQRYRPATDIPGGRIDRRASTEVALQQELFDGDGTVTLRVDNLFNDNQFRVQRRTPDFYQDSTFQWGTREVSLSLQYTFGANPKKQGRSSE